MQNYEDNHQDPSDEISLGKIFRSILMQSKIVMAVSFLGAILGFSYMFFSESVYKTTSLLQVYAARDTSQILDLTAGGSNTANIDGIKDLYRSRTLLTEVIEKNRINIKTEDLDFEEKKIFTKFKFKNLQEGESLKLNIEFSDDGYKIFLNEEIIGVFDYGKIYETNDYILNLSDKPKKKIKRQ